MTGAQTTAEEKRTHGHQAAANHRGGNHIYLTVVSAIKRATGCQMRCETT